MEAHSISSYPRFAVVYQGRYPTEISKDAGARRVRDITRGLAEEYPTTSMLTPLHFEMQKDPSPDIFPIQHLGTKQNAPTVTSRLAFWKSVSDHAIKNKFTHVMFYNTSIDSSLCMQKLRRAKVSVGYEMCDMFSLIRPGKLRKLVERCTEHYLPRLTDFNIGISSGIMAHFERVAPTTPRLMVPALFDTTTFHTSVNKDSSPLKIEQSDKVVRVCYAGTISTSKGVHLLIEAFRDIARLRPNARLDLAGLRLLGELDVDVETLIDRYDLRNTVSYLGSLDSAALKDQLDRSDILVCPHLDHPFAAYAFPTKIAEYSAMGKALVLTDVGDVSRYFENGHNSMLCKASCKESLISSIVQLIDDADLRAALGKNSLETAAKHFDYRANGRRIVEAWLSKKSVY